MLVYGQKSSVDYYHWLQAIPGPRQVWLDFGWRIRHTVPGYVLLMQLSRDPNPGLGFSDGRFSVYPMFADVSALGNQEEGDTRSFGSVYWDGLNRHEHVDQIKFYPQFIHVLKGYAPSSMMTMPKTQRMCRSRLSQLHSFQVAIQDLHEFMPVRSVRAEVTMRFTQETLMEQLRMAIYHAEQCLDRYVICEALSFDRLLVKMREWTNVAALYRVGAMRDSTVLTPDRKAIMASILNMHGVATREVMFHLQRGDVSPPA